MKNNGQKEKLRLLKPDATGHREGIEQSNRTEQNRTEQNRTEEKDNVTKYRVENSTSGKGFRRNFRVKEAN